MYGLSQQTAFWGPGAVLIGNDSLLKVNDISFELKERAQPDDDEFVEQTLELQGLDSILLVYSSGSVKFLNIDGDKFRISDSEKKYTNLVGGQLHFSTDGSLLNIRSDKKSELYKICKRDKELDIRLDSIEAFRLPSICQMKQLSDGSDLVLSKSQKDSVITMLQQDFNIEELAMQIFPDGVQISQVHKLSDTQILLSGAGVPAMVIEIKVKNEQTQQFEICIN